MVSVSDLVSAGIILVAIIINLTIFVKSFRSYHESKVIGALFFALTTLFMALAMCFLVVEKLFLSELLYNEDIGMVFSLISITCSGFSVVFIDAFSFNMGFLKRYKILTFAAACVMALYLIVWYTDPERHVAWSLINGELSGEVILGSFAELLPYFTIVPLLIIPVGTLWYFARKIKDESPVKSKKSWILGAAILVICFAFTSEIYGVDPSMFIVIIIIRSLFILGALLLYWGLFRVKPKE